MATIYDKKSENSSFNSAFSTTPDGKLVFYPTGMTRKPYIVPDMATKERLCCKAKSFTIAVFLGVLFFWQIIYHFLIDPFLPQFLSRSEENLPGYLLFILSSYAIIFLLYQAIYRKELSQLERLRTGVSFIKRLQDQALCYKKSTLIWMSILCFIMVAGSTILFFPQANAFWLAAMAVVVFGICFACCIYLLIYRLHHSS